MRFVLIALIVFFATDDGMADTSREDKIAYIVKTEDLRSQIIAREEERTKQAIEDLSNSSVVELKEKEKNIMEEEISEVVKEHVDDYVMEVVDVYVEYFTEDEIDAIYNFYRSPEGKSLGRKMPAVWRKIFWIDARYLKLVSEDASSRIRERLSQKGSN